MPNASRGPVSSPTSIARLEALDAVAEPIAKAVRDAVPAGPVKDALSGTLARPRAAPAAHSTCRSGPGRAPCCSTWLGGEDARARGGPADRARPARHGARPSSTGLDRLGRLRRSASERVRRVGHRPRRRERRPRRALFGASLAARRGGARGTRQAARARRAGALGAGGWLGGHLAYAEGVGVDQTAFEDCRRRTGRRRCADAELAEGEPRLVEVAGVAVLVARIGGRGPRARGPLLAPRRAARRGRARTTAASPARGTARASGSTTAASSAARPPTRSRAGETRVQRRHDRGRATERRQA